MRLRGAWFRIDRTEDLTGYVRTTMARLHISVWRRRRREWLTSSVPERSYSDQRIDRVDAEASRDAEGSIWYLLRLLPPRQRAVIVLRYYEHLSDDEIAEVLGVSSGTIRSQASRAMAKLRSAAIPELAKEVRA
jgi:RNA polymerase sigma factor (sigma-70 family)